MRWRFNRSTAMDCDVTAHVIATGTGTGWDVTVDPNGEANTWGLETFPNPWEIVFPDGSCFEVDACPTGVDGSWSLTETVGLAAPP